MEYIYLKVWGNYACFTRPEMKVERVTYDVITPSAARGILEAIYWKPAMRYIIDEISVLKPMKFLTIRRNEVNNKMVVSFASIKKAIDSGEAMGLDATDSRTQRLSMVLKDVCYIIKAHVELTGKCDEEEKQQAEDPYCQTIKHNEMFNRRASKGQCFKQPAFGCREFAANFTSLQEQDLLLEENRPLSMSKDLNFMLYDLEYLKKSARPVFFRAEMIDGKIKIPDDVKIINKVKASVPVKKRSKRAAE